MLVVMLTLTSVGTKRVRVSGVVILGAKFCHCILAKSTHKHLADFICTTVTLTSKLFRNTIKSWLIWGTRYSIQTEVLFRTIITVAVVDVNFTPNPSIAIRTRTIFSILMLCLINC
jgi:hypothetical protein